MLSSALGALGRRSGGQLRLAPAVLPAAPLRLVVPAVAQRFSLAGTHRARARAGHLDVDGGAASKVPRADPRSGCCRRRLAAGCDRLHGQEKEEDTDEADDMYEVDFIDLANKMARQYLGRPASSCGGGASLFQGRQALWR